jgi:hypothetical protein
LFPAKEGNAQPAAAAIAAFLTNDLLLIDILIDLIVS